MNMLIKNNLKNKLLILNEKKYVEQILNDENYLLTNNYFNNLVLIARYYFILNGDKTKTRESLISFLKSHYPKYDEKCLKTVDKIIEKYCTEKLQEINEISISKKEIEMIESVESIDGLTATKLKAAQRLLFVILVFGKWQKLRNEKNKKGWCNLNSLEILAAARVTKDNINLLAAMYDAGLIEHQESFGDNCHATFIDEENTAQIHITDLRELGYQWNKYKGDNFIECKKCGLTVKINSSHNGYCKDCYSMKDMTVARCVGCGSLFVKGKRAAIKKYCDCCQIVRNQEAKARYKSKKVKSDEAQEVA